MSNCPNCGAPITSYVCEYCGTVHDSKLINKSTMLKIENERLEKQMAIEELYISAISAMRSYTYSN